MNFEGYKPAVTSQHGAGGAKYATQQHNMRFAEPAVSQGENIRSIANK